MAQTSTYNPEVLSVIEKGLSSSPKRLPSWLFYDEKGDKIFQAIMRMPEYYLTSSEFEILQTQKHRILKHIVGDNKSNNDAFKLVELGAGDGTKTEVLLNHFISQRIDFTYVPVDVSQAVLTQLVSRLNKSLPGLKIHAECELYSDALENMKNNTSEKKLILFLGANIGNFNKEEAISFVKKFAINMNGPDRLLIGFDLKKDPRHILAAYDDAEGITREFNLNLLGRINREFGGSLIWIYFRIIPITTLKLGLQKAFW